MKGVIREAQLCSIDAQEIPPGIAIYQDFPNAGQKHTPPLEWFAIK